MPPTKRNPAAGKRPANGQTTSHTRAHTRNLNGKTVNVRASTRTIRGAAQWAKETWTSATCTRIRRTATGTAAAGVMCSLIIAEAGFTLVSTLGMALIALLTTLAVYAGNIAEQNKTTLGAQRKRTRTRRTARRATGTRKTTTRKR